MRIFLVRNGEHLAELRGRWAGAEVGLSRRGRRQADALCARLLREKPDAIYSSECVRAVDTVQPLASKLGLRIVKLSAFAAFDVGVFVGRTREQTVARLGEDAWREVITNPRPRTRYFDGGETLQAVAKRAWAGLLVVAGKHAPDECIVISTHLTVVGCVLCRMAGIGLNRVWFWGVA